MFMVDLAVLDIEPEAEELDSIYLYTIDDLQAVVEEGLGHRQNAAQQAEILIGEALDGGSVKFVVTERLIRLSTYAIQLRVYRSKS